MVVLEIAVPISYIIALNTRLQCFIHNSQCIRLLHTYEAMRYLRFEVGVILSVEI